MNITNMKLNSNTIPVVPTSGKNFGHYAVTIFFAKAVGPDGGSTMEKYKMYIPAAVAHAAVNLKTRFDVDIFGLQQHPEYFEIHLFIPDSMLFGDGFNIGNRLRGISGYLKRVCPGIDAYFSGKRLLYYVPEFMGMIDNETYHRTYMEHGRLFGGVMGA